LERGSLTGVRVAVANLPGPPPLDDAPVVCRLRSTTSLTAMSVQQSGELGRLLLEQRGLSLRQAEVAATYLAS
jgi:hypothetical protein